MATFFSYLLGSGLVVDDVIDYLNHNAAAIGAICAIATSILNWWYKLSREKKRRNEESTGYYT